VEYLYNTSPEKERWDDGSKGDPQQPIEKDRKNPKKAISHG